MSLNKNWRAIAAIEDKSRRIKSFEERDDEKLKAMQLAAPEFFTDVSSEKNPMPMSLIREVISYSEDGLTLDWLLRDQLVVINSRSSGSLLPPGIEVNQEGVTSYGLWDEDSDPIYIDFLDKSFLVWFYELGLYGDTDCLELVSVAVIDLNS